MAVDIKSRNWRTAASVDDRGGKTTSRGRLWRYCPTSATPRKAQSNHPGWAMRDPRFADSEEFGPMDRARPIAFRGFAAPAAGAFDLAPRRPRIGARRKTFPTLTSRPRRRGARC